MQPGTTELFLGIIALINGVSTLFYSLQMRRMNNDGEIIKGKDEKIQSLKETIEDLKFQKDQLNTQFQRVDGENQALRRKYEHPNVP